MARVLIVDDHAAYRCGLQCLLQPVLDDCRFEQASNLAEALTLLRQPSPFTVTIFDWHLPDSGGVKGLLALLRVCAGQPVLVVTGDPDEAIGIAAASLGADACLPKSASAQALRTQVAHLLHPNPSNGTRPGAACADHGRSRGLSRPLTRRESDILTGLAKGLSNKEMGRELGISSLTIRSHVSHLLQTLGARNRTQAAVFGAGLGLLGPEAWAGAVSRGACTPPPD